ncbi:MAG TPA: 16S rRNA (cytosine(1402)-N(4))-methyltransferase RsmH [Gemmatimonadaceae bacterium]|jgi:16S rRNA (cytosine1402-N4)-methyltransferase
MEFDSAYHAPVLVAEVVELLRGRRAVLDCTLGGGGHSSALFAVGVENIVGIDRDPDALAAAGERLRAFGDVSRFRAVQSNYASINQVPALDGLAFDGILLDLGISSHQIDDTARGFSFRAGAPLDMRMGEDVPADAADLLNEEDETTLTSIFRDYGDEPKAGRLAREIVRRRENRPFATSDDLVGAIRAVLGARSGSAEFARLFQAVRIAVNDELVGLARALPMLRDRLTPGGRLVVIAYHSGEDRLVKHTFREWSTDCICPPKQPVCTCRGVALGDVLTRRAVIASAEETSRNPRARSARLRAFERSVEQ